MSITFVPALFVAADENVGAVESMFLMVINEELSVNWAGISSELDPDMLMFNVSFDSFNESEDAEKLNVFDVTPASKLIVWLTVM